MPDPTVRWHGFPVLGRYGEGGQRSVPWAFVQPHAQRALLNHGQTLERLAERGGLAIDELVALVEDRGWTNMDAAAAEARLFVLLRHWELTGAASAPKPEALSWAQRTVAGFLGAAGLRDATQDRIAPFLAELVRDTVLEAARRAGDGGRERVLAMLEPEPPRG